MFTSNPYADFSASISPSIMQIYLIVMMLLVVVGTIYDFLEKKSARYFFQNWRSSRQKGTDNVGGGKMFSIAAKTLLIDVAASGEFCSLRRRIAHLLTMYGFLVYVISTVIMVFLYPTPEAPVPPILPQLWAIGATMICAGGYWFWFFIRVDVAAEGHSPFRVMQADIFVLSLLSSATFALIWACLQAQAHTWENIFFALHIAGTTVLFGSVPWSKFAHMFFKPAAAFEKRVSVADGSRSNLPAPADKPRNPWSSGTATPRLLIKILVSLLDTLGTENYAYICLYDSL